MAEDKIVEINCSPTIKNILCEALKSYASTCPTENSNYYFIKKSELLSIIDNIEQQFNQSPDHFSINDDIKPYMEAAICYHYDHIQHQLRANVDQQKHLLLNVLRGLPVDDTQLENALREDNII